ncbi:MAG: hypothetical protein RLZZ324_53 [Candidatus Parcubacteria bacterium]|jgi:broad specificity phosphatase PhoE
MGYPRLLVYVRHAESEGNALAEIHGSRDEALATLGVSTQQYRLSERGKAQATITGDFVRATYGEFDAIYTSTYGRTQETLHLMGYGPATFDDSRLDESQFGIFHFHTADELAALYPREAERLRIVGDYHYRAPGGENWPDVELRVHGFSDMLRREHDGQRVLVVGHGNYFRAWRRVHDRWTVDQVMAVTGNTAIANAGVAEYRADGIERARFTFHGITVPWKNDPRLDPPADDDRE